MPWLIENLEVLAGVLGVAGSIILAWPLLGDAVDRRHWETLRQIRRDAKTSVTDEEKRQLREVRDQFLDDRLGDYERHRQYTAWGMLVLGAAFALLLFHAISIS